MVGGIALGKPYIEPQGKPTIMNHNTGETAEIEYKLRGWTSTKNKETIHAVIKDSNGIPKYHIDGKYSENFILKNLDSNEEI
jgi:hypothetical protein